MVVADLIIPTLGGGVLAQPGNVCIQAGRTCRIALAHTDYRAPCQLRQKLHACAPRHGSIVEPFPIYALLPLARAPKCAVSAHTFLALRRHSAAVAGGSGSRTTVRRIHSLY